MLKSEIEKALALRQVSKKIYNPSPADIELFKSLPPADIFDKAFLSRFPEVARDNKKMSRICRHLQYTFRNRPTFGAVLDLSYSSVTTELSGVASLALLLDLVTALGARHQGHATQPRK